MGQPITVVERPSSRRGVVRFETNRNFTGLGHERYRVSDVIDGDRWVDELARRLFARGGVDAIHVNMNVVTVDLAKGHDAAGIADVIRDLYLYYREPAAQPAGSETAE